MPPVNTEVEQAKIWMSNLLKVDPQLSPIFGGGGDLARVYADQAIRELGFPYILITFMSGGDKNALGTKREATYANFQVRIVTEGSPTTTDRVAEKRMDDVLQNTVNAISGGYKFSARRMSPINRPEYDANKQVRYQNIGGIYRVWICLAP